jgi:MoxR-like ATPase
VEAGEGPNPEIEEPGPEAELVYSRMAPEFVDDRAGWQEESGRKQLFDRRDGAVYRMHPKVRLAVDVAMATGRPLLLKGEPGSGKSSLAPYLARNIGARYYEEVVVASTRVEDFLWRFDTIRKLSDAQARRPGEPAPDDASYVMEGVLWKAFDPDGKFGSDQTPDAVVLIDEVDKADPDVPNGLLVPLGAGQFTAPARENPIAIPQGRRVVMVITTNEERQLPSAFLRRCVVASIPRPTKTSLADIARLHIAGPGGDVEPSLNRLFEGLADKLLELRQSMPGRDRPPGVAEYLDAVRACMQLKVDPSGPSAAWEMVEEFTLRKTADVG